MGSNQMKDRSADVPVPWNLIGEICRLPITRGSTWRVYLALVFTSCRYRKAEVRMSVSELAEMASLCQRTVRRALGELQAAGLITRAARYRRWRVSGADTTVSAPGHPAGTLLREGASGHHGVRSPTTFYYLGICQLNKQTEYRLHAAFSDRQLRTVADVMAESSELLGRDAWQLTLSTSHSRALQLAGTSTYAQALAATLDGDKRMARDFVRAVLALRRDERVQGEEVFGEEEG
jgi:hypothetical protein